MHKRLQTVVLSMLLALLALPAWALGLGQLQLKSRLNEPLLAEIPVVSADPEELIDLQARLASPETFLRVGLPLPDKLVSDLQFAVVQDAAGRPLIRVTTAGPVRMPAWTFLVEVAWNQGKLVREYSVLLAAPEAVADNAMQPAVALPEPAPSNQILRPAPAPAPVPAPTAAAAPVTAPSAVPAGDALRPLGEVRRGQTLSEIAAAIRRPGQDLDALMAALLESNPHAFIGGDIDRLRSGALLRLPAALADAAAVEAFAGIAAAARRQAGAAAPDAIEVASAAAPVPGARLPRARAARLEIIPAAAGRGAPAAARPGSGTGGEGDVQMTQQLQEARETIASRDAEVQELKARVGELENMQKQQAQLLQMKDTALAAAQQKLQQREAQATPPAANASGASSLLWLGWLLPLALALAAGWLWHRRRRANLQAGQRAPSFAHSTTATAASVPLFPAEPVPAADQASLGVPSWLREPPAASATASAQDQGAAIAASWGPAFTPTVQPGPISEDERLALARTYLQMDDRTSARDLLRAVTADGDAASADAARAMLAGLTGQDG